MEPPLFCAPPENVANGFVRLPPPEARHAASVLRLKPAAIVVVVDGLGTAYRGELVEVTLRKVTVRIHAEHRNYGESLVRLTLAAGLSTGYKFDSVVRQGTELGAVRLVPVLSDKSKVRLDDPKRALARVRRLEKVALAAMKQCRRSFRPQIASPTRLTQFIKEQDEDCLKLFFHPDSGGGSLEQLEVPPETRRVTVLVGPESGFTYEEVHEAESAGFRGISLGSRILRTETAGPVAAALVMQKLGAFR